MSALEDVIATLTLAVTSGFRRVQERLEASHDLADAARQRIDALEARVGELEARLAKVEAFEMRNQSEGGRSS